jgi:hypothetical protein
LLKGIVSSSRNHFQFVREMVLRLMVMFEVSLDFEPHEILGIVIVVP